MTDFQEKIPDEKIIEEIEASNEMDYLRQLKKKNKEFLISGLTILEKERIARYICDRYNEVKTKHDELCKKIDEWDSVYRMERKEVPGSEGKMPNYRSPLSTVTHEVMHSNIMNVVHSPADILNILPIEEGDIEKVPKLNTFANWSVQNELNIFEATDRLFHYSEKVGESPYLMHWVKEYATIIEKEPLRNPADESQLLVDPDTQEPLFQEIEKAKLVYNAPKLEPFSRKDYFQPLNATMDNIPDWEMMRIRRNRDWYLREELQGKMYKDSIKDIRDWGGGSRENEQEDYDGDFIPIGKFEKEFMVFYGRLRINKIKDDKDMDDSRPDDIFEELEDEFIAIVNIESEVLCSLRKNKFPLKMRPIGMDYFIPDDEGRRAGLGIYELMDSLQKSYDVMYNQYVFGTMQANNPVAFIQPMGNMKKEPFKMQAGFVYPVLDPSKINIFQFPSPDQSINIMLEMVNQWAQLLFGISDFTSGIESRIDPTAPAKKAEIVVAQGNVRMNTIIKRKNKTLQDIFKRWYLLYKENMPPNKFMRIAGAGENAFEFKSVTLEDFALKSIPDFSITGNMQNSNKSLQAQKAIAVYQILIQNPFYNPETQQGMKGLHFVTKWLIDRMDEIGLSKSLPSLPGEQVHTPEEENARFIQGDSGEPAQGEDHINHIRVHRNLLVDPTVPEDVKEEVIRHIKATVEMQKVEITQQMVLAQSGAQQTLQGGQNVPGRENTGQGAGQAGAAEGMVPKQAAGMGGFEG